VTIGLAVRSLLALLLGVGVALVGLTQAAILPPPALATALTQQGQNGNGAFYHIYIPPAESSPMPGQTQTPGHTLGPGRRHQPIPSRQAIEPSPDVSQLSRVPGYIFYTTPEHNLYFVTGQHPRKQYTNDGTTVAPALSVDGAQLAWVKFKRNYSDIYVTSLGYDKGKGSVIPMTTTWMTMTDESPPPALQLPGCQTPPDYQPSYGWWAMKPSFLPDGQHLVYLTNRPGFCGLPPASPPDYADNGVFEQGVTDTMTNAVRLISPTLGTGGDDSPGWRPRDPAVFIYTNYYHDNVVNEAIIQAAMAVTGTAPTDNDIIGLTPHGATAELPAWSPDGRYIAFVDDHNDAKRSDVKVMPFHRPGFLADYYHAQTVARGAPYVTQPFWSPRGDYLGYLTSSGGEFTLVIRHVKPRGATLEFGPPIPITQAQTADAGYRPAWGP